MKRSPIKRKTRLSPISQRRRAGLKEYAAVKHEYLAAHQVCEVWLAENPGSKKPGPPATEIHHRKGRGKYLCDTNYFLAVCREYHNLIHRNTKWAYEKGYLLPRN